jgi:hypothetical protein
MQENAWGLGSFLKKLTSDEKRYFTVTKMHLGYFRSATEMV